MNKQWHPLFAHLLGLLIKEYYEIQPEVSVSDLPRQADLLLIRRHGTAPPFEGMWGQLREWNLLEFKGPTDAPEEEDLDRLVHIGTGLVVRLNEERRVRKESRIEAHQFALWYLAPQLGDKFIGRAQGRSFFEYQTKGIWQGKAWGHAVWLVSYQDTTIEVDTLPLRMLDRGAGAHMELRRLLLEKPELLQVYGQWLPSLQPGMWKEIQPMSATSPQAAKQAWEEWQKIGYKDIKDVIAILPPETIVEYLGDKRIIEAMGEKRAIEAMGITETTLGQIFPGLTPEEIQDLMRRGRPGSC